MIEKPPEDVPPGSFPGRVRGLKRCSFLHSYALESDLCESSCSGSTDTLRNWNPDESMDKLCRRCTVCRGHRASELTPPACNSNHREAVTESAADSRR